MEQELIGGGDPAGVGIDLGSMKHVDLASGDRDRTNQVVLEMDKDNPAMDRVAAE